MKTIAYLLSILCIYHISGCRPALSRTKQPNETKFLFKTPLDTSKNLYGSHIDIKQILPDTEEHIILTIDDRDIISRSRYTREDEIAILGEYLTFQSDTSVSNKRYRFKAASHMIRPEGIHPFTVEIEALFSFTRMLTEGIPPIKPMLLKCETGKSVNDDPKALKKVYAIYKKWYKENLKNDFNNIELPLSGSPYCWLGENDGIEPYLRKSF